MKRLLFVILLLSSLTLNAQSLVQKFKSYVPLKALETGEYITMVENNLQRATIIHPDAIYTYFTFLEAQIENKDRELINKLSTHYSQIVTYYHKKKYEWFNYLVNFSDSISEDLEVRKFVKKYFLDERDNTPRDFNDSYSALPLDTNKLNHCAVIFYNPESNILYDPSLNYAKIRTAEENKIINDVRLRLKHAAEYNENNDSGELKDEISHYWYLFSRLPHAEQLNIFRGIFKKSFATPVANSFYVSAAFSRNSNFSYTYTEMSSINEPYSLAVDLKNIALELSVGYMLRFKDIKTLLSYVKIEGGILLASSSGTSNPTYALNEYLDETLSPGTTRITTAQINTISSEVTINKELNFFADVSVPVFYLGNHFTFEAGAAVYYNSYDYSVNASYHYLKTIKDNTSGIYITTYNRAGTHLVSETGSMTNFKAVPIINLLYSLFDSCNLCFRGSTNNFSLRLQYLL